MVGKESPSEVMSRIISIILVVGFMYLQFVASGTRECVFLIIIFLHVVSDTCHLLDIMLDTIKYKMRKEICSIANSACPIDRF